MSEIEKVALTCETSSIYLQVICSQIGKANCSIVNNQHGRRNNSVCTAVELFRRSSEAERTLNVGRWQLGYRARNWNGPRIWMRASMRSACREEWECSERFGRTFCFPFSFLFSFFLWRKESKHNQVYKMLTYDMHKICKKSIYIFSSFARSTNLYIENINSTSKHCYYSWIIKK